ncbi:unnamed protein product [Ectocarpus sp. CCAP 1310/34]|nr:unnamed protein product [Ectocarpus sp. CCAP 1310/34]
MANFDEVYREPFERCLTRFRDQLIPTRLRDLQRDGRVVIDNFLGRGWALALLQEMRWLHGQGLMRPNETQFSHPNGQRLQFSKPNIFEVDLHDESIRNRLPEMNALFHQEALVEALAAAFPEGLRLARGTQGRTLKLQRNAGSGGCFPLHYDNPGPPNKRALTCLLYLNPSWKEGDGGEVCLTPFLQKEEAIAPLLDRLVIFRSDRVLHRVLPCNAERFMLTVWIDSPDVNPPEESTLRISRSQLDDWLGFCEFLRNSPVQRVLSRGVYEEQYEESLRDCMAGAEGYEEMLGAHRSLVSGLKKNRALHGIIERLRQTAALADLS